ncbi:hypothetical protein [Sinorhizobium meliloti]|uniref:hypothetical protein n=1 Tax=Rhizobium meliloti TaxID=382 RepID=UPI00237FF276|nr:hypothetical protein [Sinorhizobium meliloti]
MQRLAHAMLVSVLPISNVEDFGTHPALSIRIAFPAPRLTLAVFGSSPTVTRWEMAHGAGGGLDDVTYWVETPLPCGPKRRPSFPDILLLALRKLRLDISSPSVDIGIEANKPVRVGFANVAFHDFTRSTWIRLRALRYVIARLI